MVDFGESDRMIEICVKLDKSNFFKFDGIKRSKYRASESKLSV